MQRAAGDLGDKGDVHTWPKWHRGRPGISVLVHLSREGESFHVTCSCICNALPAPGQRCIAEFALLASQEARVDVDANAGLAQIACRCCCAGT